MGCKVYVHALLHSLSNYLWYKKNYFYVFLLPLSCIYFGIIKIRQILYRVNIFTSSRINKPVVIIGNITVGGTGKTPLVIYVANLLIKHGIKPGIISRGYGGNCQTKVVLINPNLDLPAVNLVGDEVYLLAKNLAVPIVVAKDRAAAAVILSQQNIDVILSDDGLQHYALKRDLEILVLDGERMLGNNSLLPAGPLREPTTKISQVDFVIVNGGSDQYYAMQLVPGKLMPLVGSSRTLGVPLLVHAIAGIGNPERFFKMLENLGFTIMRHSFPDHYKFSLSDITFTDNLPVVMTEKDAVKCTSFAGEQHWYLPVVAEVESDFTLKFLAKLKNHSRALR